MTLSDRWQELERKLGQIAATDAERKDHLRMAGEAESRNTTAKAEAAQEYDAIMAEAKVRYQELALPAPASPPAPPPPPPAADPVLDTTDAAAAAETVLTPPAATLDEGAPAATTDEAPAAAPSAAA